MNADTKDCFLKKVQFIREIRRCLEMNGTTIDFSAEWEVITFRDLILRDSGIDIEVYETAEKLLI